MVGSKPFDKECEVVEKSGGKLYSREWEVENGRTLSKKKSMWKYEMGH